MGDFFTLPLIDRLIMMSYSLGVIVFLMILVLRALKRRSITAGSVKISSDLQDTEEHVAEELSSADDPKILILYNMQHVHLKHMNELTSPSAVLSDQIINATNEINIYTTVAMGELANREDFEDISKDIELFRYKLLDLLILVYRENHLCEMDEGQFLRHLRIRSQTAVSMSTIHMMSRGIIHPFIENKSINDIMTLIIQIIITGRNIALARNKQAAEAEAEYDKRVKSILRGDYAAVMKNIC
jgi:hypothetical protein